MVRDHVDDFGYVYRDCDRCCSWEGWVGLFSGVICPCCFAIIALIFSRALLRLEWSCCLSLARISYSAIRLPARSMSSPFPGYVVYR